MVFWVTTGDRERYCWKSRVEDIACLSYHVKKIQIFHYDSSNTAFQLVKFLLRNSKVLESMEIMRLSPDKKNRKKLIALPRASSKVVICITDPRYRFHEDDSSCTEDD
ncbi:hypothetical protein ACJIZ3_007786 [Penstemon smallii]|uniref:FBD domain-containing protein n=1 Tax=Penstemon smallii TaxID=265156 RepID=A0ABD3T920_9LAMI